MSELSEVGGGRNPDRTGDVVFVHGLNGDPKEYWQRDGRPDTFWPGWIAEDAEFASLGIWCMGYQAAAFQWKGGAMPLEVRATNALDLLDQNGIGQRPIVFVTHSLGGLLIKQMLRNAKDFRKPAWKSIATHTRGIAFISTPHAGSNLATYVTYLGWLLRASVSVEDLRTNEPHLTNLNLWFRQNVGFSDSDELPIRSLVYYEEQKTRWRAFRLLGAIVVDRTSADPGLKDVIPVGLDADHRSIHRPASKSDQLYRGVRKHIADCLYPDFH
jgi:hypothetical protein